MADFNFITNRVATGAAVSNEQDVEALVSAGVTHIVDARGEFDDTSLLATHPQINYLYDGVPDDGQPKPVEWFQKAIDFCLDALSRPHTKCYLHCAAGINRGPSLAYAVLLAQGLDINLAESLMRKVRPQVGIAYKSFAIQAVTELGYMDALTGSAFGEIEK